MARGNPRCSTSEPAHLVQAWPGLGLCDRHAKPQIRAGLGGQAPQRGNEQPAHHANETSLTEIREWIRTPMAIGFSRFDVIHVEPLCPLPLVQVVTDLAPNEVP